MLCEPLQQQRWMKMLCSVDMLRHQHGQSCKPGDQYGTFHSCAKSGTSLENVDSCLLSDYFLGLPTVGWVFTRSERRFTVSRPASTIQELAIAESCEHTSDPVLDEEAWSKTTEDIARNIVTQPVYAPSEIPFPQFCMVRRHGLWEQHGESVKPSVRVRDDFLEGGQNEPVGYQYTHRPAMLDLGAGTLRVLGESYGCNLMMFCSDLHNLR